MAKQKPLVLSDLPVLRYRQSIFLVNSLVLNRLLSISYQKSMLFPSKPRKAEATDMQKKASEKGGKNEYEHQKQ